MSVAPEIARLADAIVLRPAQPTAHHAAAPDVTNRAPSLTLGTLAGRLRSIAAAPERWWDLVRFEPGRPVTVTVEESAHYRAWLVILPPGDAGHSCDCDVATMIAGETIDGAAASAALRPGSVRVHGEGHRLLGRGAGYSISLHARAYRLGRQAVMG